MTHEEIRLGDTVKLQKDSPFKPTKSYPVEGSEFECVGIITVLPPNRGYAVVQWENGKTQHYWVNYLRTIERKEIALINAAKKDRNSYKSIWKD